MATFKPLIADSLCVAYGKADVLNSVHVEINPGEITCLLGSNGAGKTTFPHRPHEASRRHHPV